MKLAQVITNWFNKMFAWWPWRQSTQMDYVPHSSSLNKSTTQESKSKSFHEGASPQTGITPRLSTMQEWPERIIQTDVPAQDSFLETHSSGLLENGEPIEEPRHPRAKIQQVCRHPLQCKNVQNFYNIQSNVASSTKVLKTTGRGSLSPLVGFT